MQITPAQLAAEVHAALAAWPFIPATEQRHSLPAGLLLAIGSRETNLRNIYGDAAPRAGKRGPYPNGCWAVGVWQLDVGSYGYHPEWLPDVAQQADLAAAKLRAGFQALGDWHAAAAAYNAGVGGAQRGLREHGNPDYYTTGGQYGADVIQRLSTLQPWLGEPDDMTPEQATQLADVAAKVDVLAVQVANVQASDNRQEQWMREIMAKLGLPDPPR